MIDNKTIDTYIEILNEELLVAMGCTEPIAIAYASSVLRNMLKDNPKKIKAGFSGNIIKNVKSVIVPATCGMHGLKAAICAGVIANAPDKKLEVLCSLQKDDAEKIISFIELILTFIYEYADDEEV